MSTLQVRCSFLHVQYFFCAVIFILGRKGFRLDFVKERSLLVIFLLTMNCSAVYNLDSCILVMNMTLSCQSIPTHLISYKSYECCVGCCSRK